MQKSRKLVNHLYYASIIIVLTLLALSIVIPCLNILALSFNDGKDSAKGGIYFWPRMFTLDNYKKVFSDDLMLNAYKITIMRTVIGTVLSVFCTATAAYALKAKTLPGRSFFALFIAGTMFFGGGAVPYYLTLKGLNLTNTFWVYIIPALYSAWNLIIMRTFFEGIPESLEESAKIDGCGYFRTFFQIVMPLSKPCLAVIALYCAVGQWNDWYSGAFYVIDADLKPVQTLLQQMLKNAQKAQTITTAAEAVSQVNKSVTSDSLKMAAVVVTTVPILCVYPFIQKYFAQGVMIGAVKG